MADQSSSVELNLQLEDKSNLNNQMDLDNQTGEREQMNSTATNQTDDNQTVDNQLEANQTQLNQLEGNQLEGKQIVDNENEAKQTVDNEGEANQIEANQIEANQTEDKVDDLIESETVEIEVPVDKMKQADDSKCESNVDLAKVDDSKPLNEVQLIDANSMQLIDANSMQLTTGNQYDKDWPSTDESGMEMSKSVEHLDRVSCCATGGQITKESSNKRSSEVLNGQDESIELTTTNKSTRTSNRQVELDSTGNLSRQFDNNLQLDDFAEPFDDERSKEERNQRRTRINRNLHNQQAYYDQKNNIESDASDIQSDCGSNDRPYTLDERMCEMVKMFTESFIPFGLLHSSFFVNQLRNSFNIRKMPKLVQMKDFFYIMHELGTKYIRQTLSGAQSYTLNFEFWKSANRRHQFITIRASYIDVFVRRNPVLASFKIYHDWSSDRYIEKFNLIFKRFKLERSKVFAVVINLRARQFINALDIYFGSEKVIYCLVHQLNSKFNEMFLNCDYEEDMLHYEEKLEELKELPPDVVAENADDPRSDNDDLFGLDDEPLEPNEDEQNDNLDNDEQDDANNDEKTEEEEQIELTNDDDPIGEDEMEKVELVGKLGEIKMEDDEDSEDELEDATLAYVKLIEEPKDILKSLNKQNINEMPIQVRVIKSLIKTYAYISTKDELLDELNDLTKSKNGQEFYLYFLLAYKNHNYLHKFLFYFNAVKQDVTEFFAKHPEIPFDLSEQDLDILDDLFILLSYIVKKLNMLSLDEDISLGKTLNIYKFFMNTLPKVFLKTNEARKLKSQLLDYFKRKHGVFERDNYYSVASLLDPKCTKYDFQTDLTYNKAIRNLHEMLCYRLDKNFNIALYRIRAPLRIELEHFHINRPYKGVNNITKFQLNSPVLQELVYDYFTVPAICFEPKKIDFEVKDRIIDCLSQVRSDTLSKVLLLNSLDSDVLDRIIDCAKFW